MRAFGSGWALTQTERVSLESSEEKARPCVRFTLKRLLKFPCSFGVKTQVFKGKQRFCWKSVGNT